MKNLTRPGHRLLPWGIAIGALVAGGALACVGLNAFRGRLRPARRSDIARWENEGGSAADHGVTAPTPPEARKHSA